MARAANTISIALKTGDAADYVRATGSIDCAAAPRQDRLKLRADRWLSLAAAPTFAIRALLSGAMAAAPDASTPLTGMVPMYVLMSAFHSPPWLGLFSHRRRTSMR
jgi:hypothetical protein